MSRKGNVFYNNILCGIIEETDNFYVFKYNREYIDNPLNKPISLTMPLSEKSYVSTYLHPFFDGLIPEGYLLEIAISKWNLKITDRMGLLLSVCENPIGAVSIKEVKE